jgi:hypothetical protein
VETVQYLSVENLSYLKAVLTAETAVKAAM